MAALPQHPALWRGDRLAQPIRPGIATGFAELDAALPGGGWPQDGLTELLPARPGIGELSLLAPALARLSQADERWLVWIAPPHLPYAPALAAAGIRLPQLILVRPRSPKEALWAAHQALAAKGAAAVLAWLPKAAASDLRRLQLAAAEAGSLALVFRPPRAAAEASPAILRLRLDAPAPRELAIHVVKRRGAPLSRPVCLDLAAAGEPSPRHALDRDPSARTAPAGVPARLRLA